MSALARNPQVRRLTLALLFCSLPLPAALRAEQVDHTPRTLSGTVTDPHHEPLRGAVVKLQVGDTSNITTFITGPDGRYVFKRLDGNVDYRVWVTFRERTTKPRDISKFDQNMDKVIDFSVETF